MIRLELLIAISLSLSLHCIALLVCSRQQYFLLSFLQFHFSLFASKYSSLSHLLAFFICICSFMCLFFIFHFSFLFHHFLQHSNFNPLSECDWAPFWAHYITQYARDTVFNDNTAAEAHFFSFIRIITGCFTQKSSSLWNFCCCNA